MMRRSGESDALGQHVDDQPRHQQGETSLGLGPRRVHLDDAMLDSNVHPPFTRVQFDSLDKPGFR